MQTNNKGRDDDDVIEDKVKPILVTSILLVLVSIAYVRIMYLCVAYIHTVSRLKTGYLHTY